MRMRVTESIGAESDTDGLVAPQLKEGGRREVLVVVPAFNEERSLPVTLRNLIEHCPFADVLVIDDGSRDRTAELAIDAGCHVLSLPFNLGVGGAVQTGFAYAAQRHYSVVVQLDADGQHPSDEVEVLARRVLEGACDVAIGSRFLGQGGYRPTRSRALGIRLLARLVSVIVRQPVTDPTSGFRAYNADAVRDLAREYPYDYPEPEALIWLARWSYRIEELPVNMLPRYDGRSSITAWISAKYMFKVVLAIAVSAMRRPGSSPTGAGHRVNPGVEVPLEPH